jgi:hypothetical protein
VKLRGHFLKGRNSDLPTMIWLADLLEPSENFAKFFNRPDNKVLDVRNVWLLNYRNFGDSDHHDSFGLEVSVYRFLVLPLLSKSININLICCE